MIRSMHTAENAMRLQQTRIDTLANNLANVNSSGFRQILTRVTELGSSVANEAGPEGAVKGSISKAPRIEGLNDNWVQTNPLVMTHITDHRRGPINSTGRDTDMALMGRGFYAVESDNGEMYTRAGSFTLDSKKQLITPDGLPVLGEGGPIKLEGETFSITNEGVVIVDGAPLTRLKVVTFDDPTRLEHLGNNLLRAPEDMAAKALPPGEIVVAQGHLEGSNVNAIDTLVAMISAQRAFEIQQKTLTTEDEMLSKTVNKLPQVGN